MAGIGGRQTTVGQQPAPGINGAFASANPRKFVLFGPGGAVSGPLGCYVGRACWSVPPVDGDGAPALINNYGSGSILGIIPREQQGLITTYLSDGSNFIPTGFGVSVVSDADEWVKNDGATQAIIGQKAYANLQTGKWNFAATASPLGGGSGTASTISAQTASVTASITGNIMAVTAVGSGTLYPGSALSGSGVASGTLLVSQLTPLLSGEAYGGVGRYYVSIPEQTVASTTVSTTYGLLTVAGTVVSGFGVGDILSGAGGGGVTSGSTITAMNSTATPGLTGNGAAGTYVTQTQTVTSTTISVSAINVETAYYAVSSGLAGEYVKISRLYNS